MPKNTRNGGVSSEPHSHVDESVIYWAQKENPNSPAKELSRAADCSYETARSWMAGKTGPGKKHLFKLMASWGSEFIAFLIEPVDETFARKRRLDIKEQEALKRIRELAELFEPRE